MSTTSVNTRGDTPATSFTSISEHEVEVEVEPTPTPKPHHDAFDLNRYIVAQDRDHIFDRVLAAIRKGHRKPQPSHPWLWCVFPQMDHCRTATRRRDRPDVWPRGHALASLDEARAVLAHPVLGPRARAAAQALVDSRHADKFTALDNMFHDVERVHSSLTIFRQAARYPVCIHRRAAAAGVNIVFREALDRFFPKELDSEDEDYDSAEEDRDDDEDGVRGRQGRRRRAGTRHKPTLQRLDAMEMKAVQRRRQASADTGCRCRDDKVCIDLLDRGTTRRVATKAAEQTVKNLKQ